MDSDATAGCPRRANRNERQAGVIGFLESGRAFNGEVPRRVDTHAASVFLVGDRAWKLKRAVRFPYLDFSTAEKRRTALLRELELNRRSASALYLGVLPVTCDSIGEYAIGGAGDTVDWLLEMRRFPDGALLSEMADREILAVPILMRLADRIRELHASAPAARRGNGARRMLRVIEANCAAARGYPSILDAARVDRLQRAQLRLLRQDAVCLEHRGTAGRIRFGHGDLHLHNIALIDGEPTPFDCLEFDDDLATIDTLYDLAFLLMDLWRRGLKKEANIVFNRYLDLSAEDEDGVRLLPLFLSVRALIRAHVCAADSIRHGNIAALVAEAHACLSLAEGLLEPGPIVLLAIGGLSGTGKSTIAREVGGMLGRAPGARILRSDVLRKRLAGVPPETRLDPSSYTQKSSVAVYAELGRMAEEILGAGHCVVADAMFVQPEERAAVESIAARTAAGFAGIWLEAAEATRLMRISARAPDASDADADVARAQKRWAPASIVRWQKLAADGGVAETVKRVLHASPASLQRPSSVPPLEG